MNGYVGHRHCGVEIEPPFLTARIACSLDLGHTGLHYWAAEFPDVHLAVSWHALVRDLAPVSTRDQQEGEGSQLASSDAVGTHQQGAGS